MTLIMSGWIGTRAWPTAAEVRARVSIAPSVDLSHAAGFPDPACESAALLAPDAPFGGLSQPAFGDINEIVFKFRNLGTSLPTPRVDLVGTGNPGAPNASAVGTNTANFADISACVDGFRGVGYAYIVPACP
jgi:hypothetical protein